MIATIVSFVAACNGMCGSYMTESRSLLHSSFLGLGLSFDWAIGFLLSKRVKNELQRIQYSNLNGQVGFELLMLFSQL